MANYVYNTLTFRGSYEDIVSLKVALKGDDVEQDSKMVGGLPLDFRKVIPQPDGLLDMAAVGTMPAWWEWCIENWGTKWNAWDIEMTFQTNEAENESELVYQFNTAWSPVNQIVDAICTNLIPEILGIGTIFTHYSYTEEFAQFSGLEYWWGIEKEGCWEWDFDIHDLNNMMDSEYAFDIATMHKTADNTPSGPTVNVHIVDGADDPETNALITAIYEIVRNVEGDNN